MHVAALALSLDGTTTPASMAPHQIGQINTTIFRSDQSTKLSLHIEVLRSEFAQIKAKFFGTFKRVHRFYFQHLAVDYLGRDIIYMIIIYFNTLKIICKYARSVKYSDTQYCLNGITI